MAKAKVGAAGIEYIQGAMKRPKKVDGHNHGNYLVMTHRSAPSTNPDCQRIYTFDADRYTRNLQKNPYSQDEMLGHTRFSEVSSAVATRSKNLSTLAADRAAFNEQKDLPGGKKTFKAYLWKVCGEAYDQQHS